MIVTVAPDVTAPVFAVSSVRTRPEIDAIFAPDATPVAAPDAGAIEDGHCKHGKLVYRESKPGSDKAWKGWFCPSPKGTPDQCAPKFIR